MKRHRAARLLARLLVAAAAACGCGKEEPGIAPPPPVVSADSAAAGATDTSAPPAALAPSGPDPGVPAAPEAETPSAQPEDLHEEERDQDPRSRNVQLRLSLSPGATGVVMWGRKRLAELRPGKMTVEIVRPRNSGPLDLAVRAQGFLPHHVRMFTDRDDRLSVRLVAPGEARGLLGYRRSADPATFVP